MKRYIRKKFFIDRGVQGALTKRILLHWLMFLAVSFVVLPLWQLILSGDLLRPFSQGFVDAWVYSAPVFVILLALLPAFVWDAVTLSHRFAGPMYRLRGALRSLGQGEDVRPVKFRKGDFWQDVADDFNAVLERIAATEKEQTADSESESETAPASTCEEESTCQCLNSF